MDRRKFIKSAIVSAAGVALSDTLLGQNVAAGVVVPGEIYTDGKKGDVSTGVENHLDVEGYVKEPSHRIPVVASADVVVVGGGAAGFAAAVSAARQGADVILVEKANFLGGLWTGGLVLPVLATYARAKDMSWQRAVGGICVEVCDELLANGWAVNPEKPCADPEAAKYLLEKKMKEAGVRVIYNADAVGVTMSGDRVESIIIACNTGRIAIKCRTAVDASGDGNIFNFTGDPHEARKYHISNSFRVGGINGKKFWPTPVESMRYCVVGSRNAEDGLDVFRVSQLQRDHRLEVWNRIEELKKDPEYSKSYLIEMGPVTGVRVTRVLDSLHNVTLEGSMEWKSYDDCIGMAGMCDPFMYKGRRITKADRPIWQIPYRSLIPRQTQNLLVAGRCFGYDAGITWDAREISTCFVTGQAAGTAAAMASIGHSSVRDVDIRQLQSQLRKDGARLDF